MSDFEHIDVTSTEDCVLSEKATAKCAYCGCQKDGILVFYCEQCLKWVHASCLRSGPPSSILGDNYFVFKCFNCTNNKESFERTKLTWMQVVTIALYNLAQTSLGNQGYFKWKEDICVFIDKHWKSLFGDKKQLPQWYCTVGSTLSTGNLSRFQSGYGDFQESGWWRLMDPTKIPEYQPGRPTVTIPRPKSSRKSHFGMSSARSNARKRYHASQAQKAAQLKAKQALLKDSSNNGSSYGDSYSNNRGDINSLPSSPASSHSSDSKTFQAKEVRIDPTLPLVAISDDEEDTENVLKDITKKSDGVGLINRDISDPPTLKRVKTELPSETCEVKTELTCQTKTEPYSIRKVQATLTQPTIRMMSLYDERKLLKKLLALSSVDGCLEGRRLRRKLLLRQKKRELGLPVLNFDATVRQLRAKEKGMPFTSEDSLENMIPSIQYTAGRILDRFLSHDRSLGNHMESGRTFRQKLIGSDDTTDRQLIVSPYTQRILKPFIRRDFETKPPKLKLLEEIVSHYHRNNSSWKKLPGSPIDYCYVRPCHIPIINTMCNHFFWPGVDLSESLQYPDFSVVALYKKMVIGFGFLVPDVSFNEAYISFLLVHPDWRRAGIATFMLYHLIQTCMGKDVTLHVSASNPSMLLYQCFGFKPERFEADFYDKYLPPDTVECAHAFYMRLRR